MDKRTLSDMARCNRTAMICHLVEASMITITFIAQLLVGSRGLLYSLLVVVLAMGPPLMELFFLEQGLGKPGDQAPGGAGIRCDVHGHFVYDDKQHAVFVCISDDCCDFRIQ